MSRVNPHIVYLSYDGLTDPLGQSQILPYVIGLSKRGYDFTVISFEKPKRFKESCETIKQLCNKHNIKWIPLTYHRKPPVISTLFDIWSLWRNLSKLHQINPVHVLHCRSYVTSLVGVRAKKKWGIKFIFDMRGFWADERVEGGLWNLRNPLFRSVYNFFKKKEIDFVIASDSIISLTENAKSEILSWNLNCATIAVIPTCVDMDLFDPSRIKKEDQVALRAELGIGKNDFVLLYLGSWGTWYLGDEMLNYFFRLRKEKPGAKFLIVTTDKIEIRDSENILMTYSSRSLVPLYISIATAGICFIKTSFSKKASSATKIGEMLAMNVPVIVNKGWGDVEQVVQKNIGLINAEENESSDFMYNFGKFNSRAYCKEELGLSVGVERYSQVYRNVLNK